MMGLVPTPPHKQPEPEPEVETFTEEHQVYSWRWSQLWDAGYDSRTCEFLALSDTDLHRMCEAKRAGITDQQALKTFT